MSGTAPTAMLDPVLLAGIADLELLARTVVDGFMHGRHRSLRTGQSLDFAQHRAYQPGDDLRRIDWRLYGRTDRFYLKTYEAETNADLRVVLDCSRSMDFGTGALTKFEWARALLASLAWLARQQGDRVGFVPLGGDTREIIPPAVRHLPLVLQAMARTRPDGAVVPGMALESLSKLAARPGIIAIASDCYDQPETIARAIGNLRARGQDVILFHVIDAAERDFPYQAGDTFSDLETDARLPIDPDAVRDGYRAGLAAHMVELERRLGAEGCDYLVVASDEPLDAALRHWLERRMAAPVHR